MMKRQRQWRVLLKKAQRKRRRINAAKKRDEEHQRDKLTETESEQSQLDQEEALNEERKHHAQEEAWLKREKIAQEKFKAERRQILEQEIKKTMNVTENCKLQNHTTMQREESKREFDRTMALMEEYLKNINVPCPIELTRLLESKPGIKVCEFYQRTNCCRFGFSCQFNHQRPLLSHIILVRHFFNHPLLETRRNHEYAESDSNLEYTEDDMNREYEAFFLDVLSEMETFGTVRNFRTAKNVQSHLRGHVFVEFIEKRSALRAFIRLQGRFYAGKRLSVEFSNIRLWRDAICGTCRDVVPKNQYHLELIQGLRDCRKGQYCNYFHMFKNPSNKHSMPLECPQRSNKTNVRKNSMVHQGTPLLSWDDVCKDSHNRSRRNWRWSESPEHEAIRTRSNVTKSNAVHSEDVPQKKTNHS